MYTRRVGRYRRNARYVDDRGSNIFGKGVFMISAPPAITELAPDWMMVATRKKRKRLEVRCAKLSQPKFWICPAVRLSFRPLGILGVPELPPITMTRM